MVVKERNQSKMFHIGPKMFPKHRITCRVFSQEGMNLIASPSFEGS